ncbi:Transposase IS66 family protein [Blastopirellula retiformator]|uniref:Transposase IS66 family protein n=1 Tax=Blastopirellula retiformator TaxID=2527970 RepID=A0A5C5V8U5_9BACT|nr:Transposase IS66 family protein [Blastopirellula retiformator]
MVGWTVTASDEERHAARKERSLPILQEFKTWLNAEREKLLPKSPIGQAATYTHNQWTALQRYCESGEQKIDNNAAERAMRPCAIGRKNWLFVAGKTGGERAAVLMSLVQTCKRNQVEPWAYLRDVFEQLPKLGESPTNETLDQLLPDQWLKAHPEHVWRIQQLRQQDDD